MKRGRYLSWLLCAAGAAATSAYAERIYVSNEDGQSVSVIDEARAAVIASIPVGKRPRGLKLNRDGSRLYVAVSGLPKCPPTTPDEECAKLQRDLKADGVAVVDTANQKVIRVLQAGSDPEQFDMSPDERRLFVANEDAATLSVVELASGKVVQRIPVGREPEGVRLSPDGRWVLVTNESDNTVTIIDTATLKVVKSVRVGQRPRDMAFSHDGRHAYVSGEFDASLYRIAVPEGEPVEQVLQMRKEARPMAVILDQSRLYLSTGRGGSVAVIDMKSRKLIAEIQVGTRPWGIALSKDGRRLYTANGPSNDVSVVDTTTLRGVKTIPVGQSPWGVVIGPAPPRSSVRESASTRGVSFQLAKHFGFALRFIGVAEDARAFAAQAGVAGERAGLDKIVVAERVCQSIDDA